MTIGLFLAISISLFTVGGAVILLWRYRDWRFGFLAGLSLFASAWVLTAQVSQLFGEGANIACGDISEAAEARMLAEIAAAEMEEVRAFFCHNFEHRAA